MHMRQPLCPRAFVQIVDVLRHDQQFARPFSIEPRQREMSGIGRNFPQPRATGIVKLMHQRRITLVGLGGRDILDPVPLPQPICRAEGSQPALRADPRAG